MDDDVKTMDERILELRGAHAKALGKMPKVEKKRIGQTGNKKHPYANLEDCYQAVRPVYASEGLGVFFTPAIPRPREGGGVDLEFDIVFRHTNGAEDCHAVVFPADGETRMPLEKYVGAMQTYAQRYALCATSGIYPDDLDADHPAVNDQRRERPPRAQQPPPQNGKPKPKAKPLPEDLDAALEALEPYQGKDGPYLPAAEVKLWLQDLAKTDWDVESIKAPLGKIGIRSLKGIRRVKTEYGPSLAECLMILFRRHDPAGDPPEEELKGLEDGDDEAENEETTDEAEEASEPEAPKRLPSEILRSIREGVKSKSSPPPNALHRLEVAADVTGWPEEDWQRAIMTASQGVPPEDLPLPAVEAAEELLGLEYDEIRELVEGNTSGGKFDCDDRAELEYLARLLRVPTTTSKGKNISDKRLTAHVLAEWDAVNDPQDRIFD